MKKSIISFTQLISGLLDKDNNPPVIITVYDNSAQVSIPLEEFINHFNPEDIGKGQCHLVFKVESLGSLIATFSLNDMFSCSGILVFSELIVTRLNRNKGMSTAITSFVVDFAKYYGYGIIQSVDVDANKFQKKSFEKNNWKIVSSFVNPKTGNKLNVWFHNLNEI